MVCALKMLILHSYVKLPEGISNKKKSKFVSKTMVSRCVKHIVFYIQGQCVHETCIASVQRSWPNSDETNMAPRWFKGNLQCEPPKRYKLVYKPI